MVWTEMWQLVYYALVPGVQTVTHAWSMNNRHTPSRGQSCSEEDYFFLICFKEFEILVYCGGYWGSRSKLKPFIQLWFRVSFSEVTAEKKSENSSMYRRSEIWQLIILECWLRQDVCVNPVANNRHFLCFKHINSPGVDGDEVSLKMMP